MKKVVSILTCCTLFLGITACSNSESSSVDLPNVTISSITDSESKKSSSVVVSLNKENSSEFFTLNDPDTVFTLKQGDTFGGMVLSDFDYSESYFGESSNAQDMTYVKNVDFTGSKTMHGTLSRDWMFGWYFVPDAQYTKDFAFPVDFMSYISKSDIISFKTNLYEDELRAVTNSASVLNAIEEIEKIEEQISKLAEGEYDSEKNDQIEKLEDSMSDVEVSCTVTISSFYSFFQSDNEFGDFIKIVSVAD